MRRTLIILTVLAAFTAVALPFTGQLGSAQPAATAVSPESARPVAARTSQQPEQLTAEEQTGRQLYLKSCASCHGTNFNGVEGRGPSLQNVGGAAAVQYVLSTGRMPLASPQDVPQRGTPSFTPDEIDALVAYIGGQVGPPGYELPTANPDPALLTRGRTLYMDNCAACHGVNGAGAAVGAGYDAPSLHPSKANTIAQAMAIGPSKMPVFRGPTWPQENVNAVATWVLSFEDDPMAHGGWRIGSHGPVSEGFVAWIIGLGLLVLAVRLLGTRTPKRLVGRTGGPEAESTHTTGGPEGGHA